MAWSVERRTRAAATTREKGISFANNNEKKAFTNYQFTESKRE